MWLFNLIMLKPLQYPNTFLAFNVLAFRNLFRLLLGIIGVHTPSSHLGKWGWKIYCAISHWIALSFPFLVINFFNSL